MRHFLIICGLIVCARLKLVHGNVGQKDPVSDYGNHIPLFLGEQVLGDSIDDIVTPSEVCRKIIALFGSAISNFTLCSVTNARPIHLCEWCVEKYLKVLEIHQEFLDKSDEGGNPCREYFTNLDRVEIVSDAFKYVKDLWAKGKCNTCFTTFPNGSLTNRFTDDVINFDMDFLEVKSCFNDWLNANATKDNQTVCEMCKSDYDKMNRKYMEIGELFGENVCIDVVDTMNITRELWSELFQCVPERQTDFWLHVSFGIVAAIPFVFYFLAYALSTKQEARVLQQRRLAEVFANTSASGMSDSSEYQSWRFQGSSRFRSVPVAKNVENCDNGNVVTNT